jgi:endonuclease/exonuclease/phosphatase family metal-dependent hydrolase
MSASVRLTSLNIERSKHLDLVIPFLKSQSPDIVCLQELMERDIPAFESELHMRTYFTPEKMHPAEDDLGVMGNGIMSTYELNDARATYYVGEPRHLVEFDESTAESKHRTENLAVSFISVMHDGVSYTIGTTHFTWTPDGSASEQQRADMRALLKILERSGEFVLTGDFNAPRGGEIFAKLAKRYTDNIPAQYETSIDLDLHRNGKTRPHELKDKMVDGLFTTAGYRARDVELHFGVSDHAAVIATISKT